MTDHSSTMTMSARSVRPVIGRLRAVGLNADAVLSAAGCNATTFNDPNARIPYDVALIIWREALELANDNAFGIHAAEQVQPGEFDVLDYAIRSSATLGEGLHRMVRYQRVLHGVATVELNTYQDRVEFTHAPPYPIDFLPHHAAEFLIAVWIVVARQGTNTDLAPMEIMFRHAAPADISEHERFFRSPIRFGSPVNGMALEHAMLDLPGAKSDIRLSEILTRNLDEVIAKLPRPTSFSMRVRQVIATELSSALPTATEAARRLHMSRRTLQRLLQEEGTTFVGLVETLRRDLATGYLREPSISIGEVAFLLGFSEASAFHRAFKRWHGVTPAAYRAQHAPHAR